MKLTLVKATLVFCMLLSWVSLVLGNYEVGQVYHGFTLIEKRFVKEVNAECFYFKHNQSGARVLKIAADDPNKTFSIAFITLPENDYGAPHIMEHAVLNGSKNFPVKSPFDILRKGSLNTFLNAMTGNEVTIYPIASMNEKDYFNLMHVYLDAVFNPLIYEDPRILKQEGWHYELLDKDKDPIYKGVVYNEMKGYYSNPEQEIDHWMYKYLFPDNNYQYDAGGYPTEIPKLTYEYFLDFHRRFYHPSNSYIFLYGDAHLDAELAFIDHEYLQHYQKSPFQPDIPNQQPFPQRKEVRIPYALPEGSDTLDQTYLVWSFVAGLNTDLVLYRGLDVLTDVLVNHESAPIRLALQKAGIGKDVSAQVYDSKQNIVRIMVPNANPGDKDKFVEVVNQTLEEVAEKGVDKKMVEGILNRMEFGLREGNDAQKGITYNFRVLSSWLITDDPFRNLEYEKPLAELKKAIKENYLEKVIRQYFLENTHSLLLILEPQPGLENIHNAQLAQELKTFRANLSDTEIDQLIVESKELLEYQNRPDSPEALATIPLLELKDIDRKAKWYDYRVEKVADIPLIYHQDFTNRIVYLQLNFDVRVLPQSLLPYAALLAEVIGSLNTENYDYGELTDELNIHTGGFNTRLNLYLENRDDEQLRPQFVVSAKALHPKVNKMLELMEEIVLRTQYTDHERLKTVLIRHQSQVENQVKQNGFGFTQTRLTSYFSHAGMFKEITGGFEYYWFITRLINNLDQEIDQISANLMQTASLLFRKENCVVSLTCEKNDFKPLIKPLSRLTKSLPKGKVVLQNWKFDLQGKNEGFSTASKIQYVCKGYNFKKLGYPWDGKMYVLSQIISSDWLQNQIRVIGGAYGSISVFSTYGQGYFASYRDPNLQETLKNYDATVDYLENFSVDESEMTRYIIGTVARYLDRPLTPSARGEQAYQMYFEKTTAADLQAIRDAILSTTAQDIKEFSKMVADILQQNVYCVYGNEEKIQSEKDLFKNIIKLGEK